MFFLVQRGDCTHFRVAEDIDPVYATSLRRAIDQGVEVLCYTAEISTDGIELGGTLPFTLIEIAARRTMSAEESNGFSNELFG